MPERPEITVAAGAGGWPPPWDAVAEIEMVLPCEHWSLIGGLMVQLHAVHNRVDAVRPTNDIDLIVHVETVAGRPATVAAALRGIGYELRPSIDQRQNTAHRFRRREPSSTSSSLTTPHPAPSNASAVTPWFRSTAAPRH